MDLKGKLTVITGAGGFVGSHLVERLLEGGARVRCFVHYNSRNDDGLLSQLPADKRAAVEVVAGDLKDPFAVSRAIKGADVIFHLAALIAIPYSYLHPRDVAETNIMGTLSVLQAALDHGVARVIHTSSSEVYGSARYVPINEEHPLQGQSPYSASKIGADKIVESFHASYGLPVATIRPFNIFGPRQSARAVIPTIITQALKCGRVFLGALETTRDFTFVSDTIEAYLKIAACDQAVGEVFNVGSGFEVSIAQTVQKVAQIIGQDIQVNQEERRMRPSGSEVQRLWADSGKAKKIFGWRPQLTFEQGLKRTIDWIADNMDQYSVGDYAI